MNFPLEVKRVSFRIHSLPAIEKQDNNTVEFNIVKTHKYDHLCVS